jgi:hypothetical protein
MSNDNNQNISVQVGPGFFGFLALIFVTLKLTHYIDWDWLWVLAPLWLPFVLVVGIWFLLMVIAFITMTFLHIAEVIYNAWKRR